MGLIERIRDGRCDLVFDLTASGTAASACDSNGVPLIRWCAYYGDVSAVRHLLEQGETLDSLGPNLDLNGAAFHGHWQLCQFLIEKGADPNYRLPDTGETALHAALSRAGSATAEHVVTVLLDSGADPGVATRPGVETGSFMRDVRARGEYPLHRAAAFGSEAVIRMLIEAGASRSALDAHGDSPLSWASLHLRPAAILRLLCFDDWSIHSEANWAGDHGAGWSGMDRHLTGRPHPASG